jgi:hypothetical protein
MMNCMARYDKVSFGYELNKQCCGCSLKRQIDVPLDDETMKAPAFETACPNREVKVAHENQA